MVSKIFSAIQKKYTSVTEAALIISIFTFCSQLLGVLRDRLLAYYIGPGATLDVYLAAFRVPDFLYIIVSTLISATVLIPLLSKEEGKNQENKIDSLFSVFFFVVCILSVVVFIAMPLVGKLIAPGFQPEQMHRLILLSRIMLLSPIILGISNFIGSINQYHKKFFAYASAPVLYNLGLIFGILFFYKHFGLYGLGLGVLLGSLLHLSTQLFAYTSSDYKLSITLKQNYALIKEVLRISLPRTLTLSLSNLLIVILTAFVSHLKPGSISVMTFALNIAFVPIGLIGIPFSTAVFPYLVNLYKNNEIEDASIIFENTLEKIIFWTITLASLFIVYRAHLVRIILGTKFFSWEDTTVTAALVFIFVIGVVFQSVNQLFIRSYYAKNNTKKPLFISLVGFLVTLVTLALVRLTSQNALGEAVVGVLRLITTENTQIMLVAFSYVLGMCVTACLFVYYYSKDFSHNIYRFFFTSFFKSIFYAIVLGSFAKFWLYILQDLARTKTLIGIIVQAGLSFGLACIMWFIILYAFNNNHVDFITKRFKNFFANHKFILEENQDL